MPVYRRLEVSPDSSSSDAVSEDELTRCYELILSLLTTSFELRSLISSRNTISLWDMSNEVFSEATSIYDYFLPALIENNEQDLKTAYAHVLDNFFKTHEEKSDFLSRWTESRIVSQWYQDFKVGNSNVTWHEPELLLHTFLHVKPKALSLVKINQFLDDLIHTYGQDKSQLWKRIRVNVLFNKLMKTCEHEQRSNIELLLNLYDLNAAKDSFLSNAAKHITSRLLNINTSKAGKSLCFFTMIKEPKKPNLQIPITEINHISCILDAFKNALGKAKEEIEPPVLNEMRDYLLELSRTILTVEEKEIAQHSVRHYDYWGSPPA
jgi:hypothetical protein